jgi:hypothetical protein
MARQIARDRVFCDGMDGAFPSSGSTLAEVHMVTAVIFTVPAVALQLIASPTRDCQFGRVGDPEGEQRALVAFETAVDDYAALHRRLARVWPPVAFLADLEERERAVQELRAALRDARPQAAQGGFFTPPVADVFRVRLARAVREQNYDVAAMTAAPDEGDRGAGRPWTVVVNEPLPPGVTGATWPILSVLPTLPLELEYRFVGTDLMLVDIDANLVVDVLDLALPTVVEPPAATPPVRPYDEPTVPDYEEPVMSYGRQIGPAAEEPLGCWFPELEERSSQRP